MSTEYNIRIQFGNDNDERTVDVGIAKDFKSDEAARDWAAVWLAYLTLNANVTVTKTVEIPPYVPVGIE